MNITINMREKGRVEEIVEEYVDNNGVEQILEQDYIDYINVDELNITDMSVEKKNDIYEVGLYTPSVTLGTQPRNSTTVEHEGHKLKIFIVAQ